MLLSELTNTPLKGDNDTTASVSQVSGQKKKTSPLKTMLSSKKNIYSWEMAQEENTPKDISKGLSCCFD